MLKRRFCANSKLEKSDPKLPSGQPRHASGHPSVSRRVKQFKVASIRTSRQRVQTLIWVWQEIEFPSLTQIWENSYIRPDDRATPSGCYPTSWIRPDVKKNCNRPDVRATLSRRGLDMVLREARYGKPVAQLSVRTASACVWTLPRENRINVKLGLL